MPESGTPLASICYEAGGREVGEVLRFINETLAAKGVLADEYPFSDRTQWETAARRKRWPTDARWVVSHVVRGGSEGFYIHLSALTQRDENGRSVNLWTMLGLAKTYRLDNALEISNATTRLLAEVICW